MSSTYKYEFEALKESHKINFHLKKLTHYIFEIYTSRPLG